MRFEDVSRLLALRLPLRCLTCEARSYDWLLPALRDWLTQHPDVARAYDLLKVKLAAVYGNDMPRYTGGKASLLRRTVDDARRSKGLPEEHDWNE